MIGSGHTHSVVHRRTKVPPRATKRRVRVSRGGNEISYIVSIEECNRQKNKSGQTTGDRRTLRAAKKWEQPKKPVQRKSAQNQHSLQY